MSGAATSAGGMPPAAAGGPAPSEAPPGFLARLVRDWPLKIFAIVLAFMIWVVVREQITTSLTVNDVIVDVEVPDGCVVVNERQRTVRVQLHGTYGDVAPARASLETEHVHLRLANLAATAKGGERTLDNPADFTFPFEQTHVVANVTPPVVVKWARLKDVRLPVDPPSFVVPPDANIEALASGVTLELATVRVRGPEALVETLKSISPDPVDVANWWKERPDLSTPMSWESGFDAWRAEGPGEAALRAPRVLSIAPDRVTGRAKFRQTGSRVMSHELRRVSPATAPSATEEFDYSIEGGSGYDRRTSSFETKVKGDKKSLDYLERSPDDWLLWVELPPPPEPGAPAIENREVPVFLVVKRGGATVSLDGNPTVFVTVRPKKPR